MKTVYFITLLVLVKQFAFGQNNGDTSMLIVYIKSGWNKEKKVSFYTINPDGNVPAAQGLYALKSVSELLPDYNDPNYNKIKKERFKTINKDSIIYNYFESESEALNYIIYKGWKLFSIVPQINTSFDNSNSQPISNTYSQCKYYFIKTE
jgi:hypothetical protein